MAKLNKKNNLEIFSLIDKAISTANYVFCQHAKQRLIDRNITDIDVLDILEGKLKRVRKAAKDTYNEVHNTWNYCIEGVNLDREKIRIIFSFNEDLLLIITVIRLSNSESL